MTPENRRELTLAFIELAGTFQRPGSPERNAWAQMWDQAATLNGGGLDEDRLTPAVCYAMRQAARNLQRAVDL